MVSPQELVAVGTVKVVIAMLGQMTVSLSAMPVLLIVTAP